MSYNSQIETRSLYIHWPFCPYRCHFCPFVALASHDQFMERYHKALCAEIEIFANQCNRKLMIDTIYMGGGTPSTYPDELLLDTFDILRSRFDFSADSEITIEVNPGTVRTEQLTLWKSLGINRMSIGVQSLKDKALQKLNRLQSASDVYALIETAPMIFDDISIDLILGLPDVSIQEWKEFLSKIVQWPITHLSMYFLMVHENTPLYFKVQSKKVALPKDKTVVDLYYWSRELLVSHGFKQYEVSNFAKQGYESHHNTVYWERNPYKAFGLGACSFDGQSRFQNEKNLMKYLANIEQKKDITVFREDLTVVQVRLEKIMLGLRRAIGISLQTIVEGLDDRHVNQVRHQLDELAQLQLIEEHNGNLLLTPAGLILENEIVARLSS